jgi:hypothetical protein
MLMRPPSINLPFSFRMAVARALLRAVLGDLDENERKCGLYPHRHRSDSSIGAIERLVEMTVLWSPTPNSRAIVLRDSFVSRHVKAIANWRCAAMTAKVAVMVVRVSIEPR